jgi:hypothetical protein
MSRQRHPRRVPDPLGDSATSGESEVRTGLFAIWPSLKRQRNPENSSISVIENER